MKKTMKIVAIVTLVVVAFTAGAFWKQSTFTVEQPLAITDSNVVTDTVEDVEFSASESETVEVYTTSVNVVDTEGNPVEGVEIYFSDLDGNSTVITTGADGVASIEIYGASFDDASVSFDMMPVEFQDNATIYTIVVIEDESV